MKETNDGPFGLTRIVTDGGTTFFRNSNGIFDESGKRMNDFDECVICESVLLFDGSDVCDKCLNEGDEFF